MKTFKFDMDTLLRNCERYGVKVEKETEKSGVTMNGQPFDVEEVIESVFQEISTSTIETSFVNVTI